MRKKSVLVRLLSVLILFFVSPALVFLGYKYLDSTYYYISAVGIILLSLLPFFVSFEKRKIKTSEIVTVAVLVALSVSSRVLFAFVPQVKPMCAFVIISAIAFGENVGFVVGATAVFVSNFAFGQGMFTPFQMLGMGLVGFLCGVIFYRKKASKSKVAVSLVGALLTFFVYGFVVDTCSVLMTVNDYTVKSVAAVYASGVVFNLIHAVSTGIFLLIMSKPMNDKLSRLNIKYGIFAETEDT